MASDITRRIRRSPGWLLVRRIRRAGRNQQDIAEGAGVSQSLVNDVIHRRGVQKPETAEKVWQEIERVLSPAGDGGPAA